MRSSERVPATTTAAGFELVVVAGPVASHVAADKLKTLAAPNLFPLA